MRNKITAQLMATFCSVASELETHATLNQLFRYAGAPGDPPDGSKMTKTHEWLQRINENESLDPLDIFGRLIEKCMEAECDTSNFRGKAEAEGREKLLKSLARAELQYVRGGKITGIVGSPSRSLSDLIKKRDLVSVNNEFDRAISNVESSPREAISAACNILEALFKTYIEDQKLVMPAKQDLQPVWQVVRKDLGLDPSTLVDRDLQEILSGIFAVVNGVGALRTHASSAHAQGREQYQLEPRHARLAIHSAHTVAMFVFESWDKKLKATGEATII